MAKAQRVLSIEIGYSLTQVCEMDYHSKHPKVYGVFSMKTPEGIMDDGFVKVDQDFVIQLKANLSANGMTAKKVMFVVSSTKIANREARIPDVKEKQIKDLVMSNITDYFPVDPTMFCFTHTVMDKTVGEDGNKQIHLMVMAAPAEMLEGYVELARALQLEFDSIDYSGNSIFQALKGKLSTGVNLTVKIDERSSLITVTKDSVITMQRAGMYGADQVVGNLMDTDVYGEALSYDAAVKTLRRNNLVMSPEEEDALAQREAEAEKIAKENALLLKSATSEGDHRNLAAATVAAKQADANLKMLRLRKEVTYSYQQLVNSIIRVIDYYNSKNREDKIEQIIITGIAADFWGFSNLLAAELGREVDVLKDLAGTSINQGLHLQGISLGDYIAVIGAGLSDTGFTPISVERKMSEAKSSSGLNASKDQLPAIVCVVGVALSLVIAAKSLIPYIAATTENTNLTNKKRQLEPIVDIYKAYNQTKADYNYLTSVYAVTDNYNRGLYDLFDKLEKKFPSTVSFDTITVSSANVVMAVTLPNKRAVAKAVMNLREIECFSDVLLTSISQSVDQETGEVGFKATITCVYGMNPNLVNDVETEADAQASE